MNNDKMNEVYNNFLTKRMEYFEVCNDIQKYADVLIRQLIAENEGEISGDLLDGIYITYDGGNRPEYECNMESIYLKDGQIYFDLEYESQYSFDRVSINDIVLLVTEIMSNRKHLEEIG